MARKAYYLVRRADRLLGKRPVIYARFRQLDGSIGGWVSTGETSTTAAELWAQGKLKDGTVATKSGLTLESYAKGWWTDAHAYTRSRRARGVRLSPVYLSAMRGYTDNHVITHLGKLRLADITETRIER